MIAKNKAFGRYRIKDYSSSGQAIVREPALEPFQPRDYLRRANVLVFMNEDGLDAPRYLGRHLASALASDPYFQVVLATEPEPGLAERADVVIMGLDEAEPGFLESLGQYNHGTRLITDLPNVHQRLTSLRDQTQHPLAEYIGQVKSDLQKGVYR